MRNNPKVFKFPNGNTIEVYTIGELCYEVGRTPDTVRKWELSGILPPTCFRDKRGHRLYTQEQIDVIRLCAEKSNLGQGRNSLLKFKRYVNKELKKLETKYIEYGGYINGEKKILVKKSKDLLKKEVKKNAHITRGNSKEQKVLKEGNPVSISEKINPYLSTVIGLNKGITKNMDNFESLRVDVWCSRPLAESVDPKDGYSEISDIIDEVLEEIVAEYI